MLRAVVLVLTVLTGATGLVYEVAWQKYLATLLGSHSEATATVLGLFLAGLSIGYALFGSVAARVVERARERGAPPRLLPLYGLVEAGIGVYALVYPWTFRAIDWLSLQLPGGAGTLGFGVDVILSALLILPPTILMGGTIPLLTQGLSRDLEHATRFHALVYGFNTAGAFVGALSAGFFLIPWLGLDRVMWLGGTLNVLAGLVMGLLGRRQEAVAAPRTAGPTRAPGAAAFILAAALTGFAMMGVQTVMNRVGALALGSSPYTFSMVAAAFVLCIAAGSLCVSLFARVPERLLLFNQVVLLLWLLFLDSWLPDAPFYAHLARTTHSGTSLAFYSYHWVAFQGVLAVVGPAAFTSGATLPLIFHHLRRTTGDLGATAGSLYAWNTIGSLVGALGVGYALLHVVELQDAYRVSVAAVLLSVLVLMAVILDLRRWVLAGVAFLGVAAVAQLPPWDMQRMNVGFFRLRTQMPLADYTPEALHRLMNLRLLDATDDPTLSVAAFEQRGGAPEDRERLITVNGKSDSSTGTDRLTTALSALLPALIADDTERFFIVGWGTGVTVGELAALDRVGEVEVAEISSGVMQMDRFFAESNLDAGSNPKVRVTRSDAYRALLKSDRQYDGIISEPSNPWVAGVEMLYSREFLSAARDRLAPGGVYLQWIHRYELDARTLDLVLRTYADVFPEVAIWYGVGPDLLLLGFPEAGRDIDLERMAERAASPDVVASLERLGIAGMPGLLAHELWPRGILHAYVTPGVVQTLNRPVLNYWAARAFFRGSGTPLPFSGFGDAVEIGRRNSSLRRFTEQRGAFSEADWERFVGEACRWLRTHCAGLMAEWRVAQPEAKAAQQRVIDAWQSTSFPDGKRLDPETVDTLAAIANGSYDDRRRDGLANALHATSLYREFFAHGTSFEPRRVERVWNRCYVTGGDRQSCRQGAKDAGVLLESGRLEGMLAPPPRP